MSSPWFPVKLPRTFRFLSILISAFPLELVPCLFLCRFSSMILSVTRKKSAGILCVWQGFLTQPPAKSAEKTCGKRCETGSLNKQYPYCTIFPRKILSNQRRAQNFFWQQKTASHKSLYEAVYGLFRLFTVRKPPELLLQAADRFCCWDCHNPPFPRRLPLPHPA